MRCEQKTEGVSVCAIPCSYVLGWKQLGQRTDHDGVLVDVKAQHYRRVCSSCLERALKETLSASQGFPVTVGLAVP